MGCDEAIPVSGREFGGSDTFATSQILAAAIAHLGLDDDIIFCGRQAIDGDTAQVGPQIAEKLDIPQASYAADLKLEGNTRTAKRMLEDCGKETVGQWRPWATASARTCIPYERRASTGKTGWRWGMG